MSMKRGVALALLAMATSAVVSAQVHGVPPSVTSHGPGRGPAPGVRAGITSLGPRGFSSGVPSQRVGSSITFGHHPGFIGGSHVIHRRYYPGVGYYVPYYWPYYAYGYPYDSYGAYDSGDYPQSQPAPTPPPDEDYYGSRNYNSRSAPQTPAHAPPAPAAEQDPTVLVFRDGHRQEVRNYAIVGQMLWDFGAKGTRKIPLADLDLDTTRKLNDERGVEFVLPKT